MKLHFFNRNTVAACDNINTVTNMKAKTKALLRGCAAFLRKAWIAVITIVLFPSTALAAGDIGSSNIAQGTEKLLQDVTTWLMILVPAVTVLVIIYYLIRRAMSDESDHRRWNSRITTALISCIAAVGAAALINVLVGYFQ